MSELGLGPETRRVGAASLLVLAEGVEARIEAGRIPELPRVAGGSYELEQRLGLRLQREVRLVCIAHHVPVHVALDQHGVAAAVKDEIRLEQHDALVPLTRGLDASL